MEVLELHMRGRRLSHSEIVQNTLNKKETFITTCEVLDTYHMKTVRRAVAAYMIWIRIELTGYNRWYRRMEQLGTAGTEKVE